MLQSVRSPFVLKYTHTRAHINHMHLLRGEKGYSGSSKPSLGKIYLNVLKVFRVVNYLVWTWESPEIRFLLPFVPLNI